MRELNAFGPGGLAAAVLGRLREDDPHRPRLVWYGSGRTELSTASMTNWSAKTAGYLVDELGAEPGDTVLWRVRRSWQGLPLLLGSWWADMVVTDRASGADVTVAFVDEGDEADADEVVVASSHPFGLPVPGLPAPYRDVADAVLPQADRFVPRAPAPPPDAPAIVTESGTVGLDQLVERVRLAADPVARHGAVLLSVLCPDLPDGVCAGALAAWAAGGTLVQLGPDAAADAATLARIAADERVTVTVGVDVEGLPRVG